MNDGINLISNRNEQLEKEQRLLRTLRVVAVSMLVTVAIVSVLVFFISFQIPLSALKQQQNAAISSISSLHNKLTTYYLTKDRVANLTTLLSTRKDYAKPIEVIFSKVSSELSIDVIDAGEKEISIGVSSRSLVSLDKFINDMFELGSKGKIIKKVSLESLTLNPELKTYNVRIKAEPI